MRNRVSYEAVDEAGAARSQEIAQVSRSYARLLILDESVTTFMEEFLADPDHLTFHVTFPAPGKYKAWLEFRYARKAERVPFVLEVK